MSDKSESGYLFKWSIENFSFCGDVGSPNFFPDERNDTDPYYVHLHKRKNEKNIKCGLYRTNKVFIGNSYNEYKIEIIGPSGKVLSSKELRNTYYIPISVEAKEVMQDIEETGRDVLIIYCHIYKLSEHIPKRFEREVCTEIQVDRLNFKWAVPCSDQEINKKEIISFPSNAQFNLYMSKVDYNIRLRINKNWPSCIRSHFIKLKLTLLEAYGNKEKSWIDNHLFDYEMENSNIWDFPLFLTMAEVNSDDCKYIKNGCLFFLCDISCSGCMLRNIEKTHHTSGKKGLKRSLPSLQEDLQLMFQSKKCCDVKLRVDGNIIEAHKFILSSRSPVFSSMFDHDMLEAQTGIVDIPDVDVCTINSFLNYLYTDTVAEMDYESATNLIRIADKYQVISLKHKCATYLESELSVENACEVAALADSVFHNELKSNAVDFIATHSKIILTKPEWLPWMKNNMELATEIFSNLTETVTLS